MLFIAFDQATNTTGYSVFLNRELLKFGKFTKTGSNEFYKFSAQIEEITNVINEYTEKYPKEKLKIILEDIQMQANVATFKTLARLQGAIGTRIIETYPQAEMVFISASTWKSFAQIKGRGRTEQKRNAQKKVEELFGVKVTQDEADALLLGYQSSHSEINW